MTISAQFSPKYSIPTAKVARWQRQYLIQLLILLFVLMSAQVKGQAVITSVIETTGCTTDLAISGQGYFILRDPDSSLLYVTRNGEFRLDANGYLVSIEGMSVQGFCDTTLTNIGDIVISDSGGPGGVFLVIMAFNIGSDGAINTSWSDGTGLVLGQILLQNISHPELLKKAGKYIYSLDPAAGMLPQAQPPGMNGLGSLQIGSLEPPVETVELNRIQGPAPLLTHGLLHPTGVPMDFGIEGNGYFILRDPNSQALFATRAGAFELDTNGFLVNYSGLRVQGFSDDHLSVVGDIHLNPSQPLAYFSITRSGRVFVTELDGTTYLAGEILLRDCLQPSQLAPTNFSLYPVDTNGAAWSPMTIPEQSGLGWIAPGYVETKQFDESLVAARRKLNYFSQGCIVMTGNRTDLAINGLGFFIVRNPADNSFYATRDGNFELDVAGHLVTTNGWRVQGLTDMALSQPGDLVIDASQRPAGYDLGAAYLTVLIDAGGNINVILTDASSYVRGQITLQYFRNPQALQSSDGIYFTNVDAAMPMFTNAAPGSSGLGRVMDGALEIIPSCQMPELEPLPQLGFRIQANNLLDGINTIDSSDDLIHWNSLGTVFGNDIGAAEFFDTNAPANSCRFYRTQVTLQPMSTMTEPIVAASPSP
jgi:flagellar hook protein FlgE